METTTKINIATIVKCPECLRKLCKIREYTDGKKTYRINAANNLIEEIEIGRG